MRSDREHRGASLFEDNINQKKENQELKKKHEEALADAHNLRQSLEVFKRIKMELEAKILQLQGAALQARHATPVKEPKGKQPAAWAVKGFEEMMSYTDARLPRAQSRMQRVTATGAGPSSYAPAYAPAYDELRQTTHSLSIDRQSAASLANQQQIRSATPKQPLRIAHFQRVSVRSAGVFCVT